MKAGNGGNNGTQSKAVTVDFESNLKVLHRPRNCPSSRPCRRLECRYHLAIDAVSRRRRPTFRHNFPGVPLEDLQETCALEAAERNGGLTHAEIAVLMNTSTEQIKQIEQVALKKVSIKLRELRSTGDLYPSLLLV